MNGLSESWNRLGLEGRLTVIGSALILVMVSAGAGFQVSQQYGLSEKVDGAYQAGYENGRDKGFSEAVGKFDSLWKRNKSHVLFRHVSPLERKIAVSFPESNLSYVCDLSRTNEWRISQRAYLYNGSTDCSLKQVDLVEEWDTSYDDLKIYNRVEEGNSSENGTDSS